MRRLPIGAEIVDNGVNFRLFAPLCSKVHVVTEEKLYPLENEGNGYFSATIAEVSEGVLYRFKLDDDPMHYPDPASRFQPDGPFGPSMIINNMKSLPQYSKNFSIEGQVIYELHIGSFTQEGTLKAAAHELKELAEVGITLIELMPLNDFPGKYGWGYDGVNLFAPTHNYGTPEDLHAFIQTAHDLGIGVILDVVYNHLGPEGNFLLKFSDDFFLEEDNEWGKAINFDIHSTREFFLSNVRYWIEEFQFDGLRVDATQCIISTMDPNFLKELPRVARESAKNRQIIIIAENESQNTILLNEYGFDGVWNDDFHHTALVRLLGKREAYYTDYTGTPQELISCFKYGYLYQGQYYMWQDQCRGKPAIGIKPSSFVVYLENHDQVANTGFGLRLAQVCDPSQLRAMTALMLLGPCTPLLFQGQEFGSTRPFLYFSDFPSKLANDVEKGRREFLSQFKRLNTREVQEKLPTPSSIPSFTKAKLDFKDRERNKAFYQMVKDLLKIRKNDPVISDPNHHFDGSVLNENAFLLRYFSKDGNDRLILVNFGIDHHIIPAPEPLLAPPLNKKWKAVWSTEFIKYGGLGSAPQDPDIIKLPAHALILFEAETKS